jgi:hypothetical protein
MLIGPMQSHDNLGEIGGAAGNRTRVQSAYYVRVYPHSPAETGQIQYRALVRRMEGAFLDGADAEAAIG